MSTGFLSLPPELVFGAIAVDSGDALRLSATCRTLRRDYGRFSLHGLFSRPLELSEASGAHCTTAFRYTLCAGIALVPEQLLEWLRAFLRVHGVRLVGILNEQRVDADIGLARAEAVVRSLLQLRVGSIERQIQSCVRQLVADDQFVRPNVITAVTGGKRPGRKTLFRCPEMRGHCEKRIKIAN